MTTVYQLLLESGDATHRLPLKNPNLQHWAGKSVVLGIRPEQITQISEDKPDVMTVPSLVEFIEPTGPDTLVTVRVNGVKTVCRVHPSATSVLNELMPLQYDLSKAVFFDPQTQERID